MRSKRARSVSGGDVVVPKALEHTYTHTILLRAVRTLFPCTPPPHTTATGLSIDSSNEVANTRCVQCAGFLQHHAQHHAQQWGGSGGERERKRSGRHGQCCNTTDTRGPTVASTPPPPPHLHVPPTPPHTHTRTHRNRRLVSRLGTIDYLAPEILDCPVKQHPMDNKQNPSIGWVEGPACGVALIAGALAE